MQTYPIKIWPKDFKEWHEDSPLFPVPQLPSPPTKKSFEKIQPKYIIRLSICIFITCIILIGILYDSREPLVPTSICLLIVVLMLITLLILINKAKHMNLKFAYEVESIYNIEVSTYKIAQLEEWDYLFNKLNSKYKPIARKCHMTSFTKCLTQKANVAEMKPNRGYCESYFSGFLSKYFSEYIYWGLALPVVDYNYFQLYPDFLLYLPKHNLHVAIEIDEYYTQIDNTPIHYCDDNFPYTRKDENNERYYAKAHWFVIRFSEDQVIFTPNECCQEINKFINEIIYPASIECLYIEKDLDISRPVWTYCGALKLANDNEREKGFEYIHSVNPFYNSKGNSVLKNAKDYEMDYQIHDRSKSEQFIYLLERTIPIDFSQYLEAWIVGYKKEYKEDDELPF